MKLEILPLAKIVEDPDQPRKALDDAALAALADSIRQHGLLNPITVTPLDGVDAYRIVTGERRWRASQRAGLDAIACIVAVPSSDRAARTTEQLIENLQREELAPLDKAKAVQALKESLGATNKEIGARLGISERSIGYLLDLLALPETIAEQVISAPNRPADGSITETHGRFLGQLNDQPDLQAHLLEKIRGEKLSSADTGKVAKALRDNPEHAERILDAPVNELPSILGKKDDGVSFSTGGAFVKILDRVPATLEEIQLEKVSARDLPAIEERLLAARAAIEKLLAEVRAARNLLG